MRPTSAILEERISDVMAKVTGISSPNPPAVVKPTADPKFGDYQANGVMPLAKKLKRNPRELADRIVSEMDLSDMCEKPEVAGPGFINLQLKPDWLSARLGEILNDPKRFGIDPLDDPPVTVVDFSCPNIAKQMHVGHLRSTVIGDVIARILEFWYADDKKVIRQNHVGDWGLQMGMVICAMQRYSDDQDVQAYGPNDELHGRLPLEEKEFNINELEFLYKEINEEIKENPGLADECREAVANLQNNSPKEMALWEKAKEVSLNECLGIYTKLNVCLNLEHVKGESFYNDKLPSVIDELREAGLLKQSDGAQCVFMDGFKTKEGDPLPLIVQKSDGAYLYATTDLAAIRYRGDSLNAKRIIYVTDSRQKLHFNMVFACARQAGWAPQNIVLQHVPFGSVLGDDGKPFKTRSGETVKLKDLLDEAEKRARKIVQEKNPDLDDPLKDKIATAVGIGAVKYADLSNNLISDYVFNWDKMLAMDGNTAPYMQYAYARIQSIFRKGNIDCDALLNQRQRIDLSTGEELALAKKLLRYGEVVESVARELRPHLLTNYLFELTQSFSVFYTRCPVLKAQDQTRDSRLLLCRLTADTIQHGLCLLGIETIDKM